MKKVLLIEDHDEMRDLISFNLEQEGFEVIASENANEGLIHIDESNVDIILLDLMLPGLKGMQFLQILRRHDKYSEIPVIIISAKNAENDVVAGLEAGADDYLTKPFSMKVLAAKINAILRRKPSIKTETFKTSGIEIDSESYRVYVDTEEVTLTNKEFELLSLMMKHPRRVFTRNQILNTVWGYDSDVYTRTVDTHVSSLRKKLGEKGKSIKSVPKIGYRFEVD